MVLAEFTLEYHSDNFSSTSQKQQFWRNRMAELFADVPGQKIAHSISVLERVVEVMQSLGDAEASDLAEATTPPS